MRAQVAKSFQDDGFLHGAGSVLFRKGRTYQFLSTVIVALGEDVRPVGNSTKGANRDPRFSTGKITEDRDMHVMLNRDIAGQYAEIINPGAVADRKLVRVK